MAAGLGYVHGMPKVLIVEDDPTIRAAVTRTLTGQGYAVATAHTAMSGLHLAVSEHPDVVVLDLGLPDLDGREVLRMIRAVIGRADHRGDRARAPRPRSSGRWTRAPTTTWSSLTAAAQLDARIRAVLRRSAEPDADAALVRSAGCAWTGGRGRRSLDGQPLDLTPREFDLLHYLAARAGTVVTKQELLVEVWQQPYGGADKSVDVHLSWLRRKLGETAQQPRYLHTVRRVGVRLAAPRARARSRAGAAVAGAAGSPAGPG